MTPEDILVIIFIIVSISLLMTGLCVIATRSEKLGLTLIGLACFVLSAGTFWVTHQKHDIPIWLDCIVWTLISMFGLYVLHRLFHHLSD